MKTAEHTISIDERQSTQNMIVRSSGASKISMRMFTAVLLALVLIAFWGVFQLNARPSWQEAEGKEPANTANEVMTIGDLPTQEFTILVHISGAVSRPGVYQIPAESRVIDVVQRAGGFHEDADVAGVNLARMLHDAEQVNIPRIGDSDISGSSASGLININTADQTTLDTLPRIGPSLATRIIQHREQYGPFRDFAGLLAVSGIGPAVIEDIRDKITF